MTEAISDVKSTTVGTSPTIITAVNLCTNKAIIISQGVWDSIIKLGMKEPERGAILGKTIEKINYFFEDTSYHSKYEYCPNTVLLNSVIRKWELANVQFCGIVHTHLYGNVVPSLGDKIFAKKNVLQTGRDLIFPIVSQNSNNAVIIACYRYNPKTDNFDEIQLVVDQFEH